MCEENTQEKGQKKRPKKRRLKPKVFLPERLQELRVRAGISQGEAARRVGVGRSTMSQYENGMRTPFLPMVQKLAQLYSTTPGYLTGARDSAETVHYTELSADTYSLIREIQKTESYEAAERDMRKLFELIREMELAE